MPQHIPRLGLIKLVKNKLVSSTSDLQVVCLHAMKSVFIQQNGSKYGLRLVGAFGLGKTKKKNNTSDFLRLEF